ncbi:MAG: methyltransferase domain-containing protein [Proteobacteria bacterium]|nr:methyltransferase domain-containing protein [Pseudomonadota bacterium]
MDLKEADIPGIDVDRHWYYISKARTMVALLGSIPVESVLDIGAGSGYFTRYLVERGLAKTGICLDNRYAAEGVLDGSPAIQTVRSIDSITQDLVLMMDVIEHTDDDVAFLSSYAEMMPEKCRLLITVPAFLLLWSGHDEFLEHRRRYTMSTIETAVRASGLSVIKSRYFFGLLFPIAAALRIFGNIVKTIGLVEPRSAMRPAGVLSNDLLIGLHDMERRFILPCNRLAGLSVFCLAERT